MSYIRQTDENRWRVQVYTMGQRRSATFMSKRDARHWGEQTERKIRESVAHRLDLQRRIGANESIPSATEILDGRVKLSNNSGIYILFSADKVTYVGQSKNVLKRITSHADKGRAFDSYYVITCLPEDLDKLEAYYIKLLQPPENRTDVIQFARSVKRGQRATA